MGKHRATRHYQSPGLSSSPDATRRRYSYRILYTDQGGASRPRTEERPWRCSTRCPRPSTTPPRWWPASDPTSSDAPYPVRRVGSAAAARAHHRAWSSKHRSGRRRRGAPRRPQRHPARRRPGHPVPRRGGSHARGVDRARTRRRGQHRRRTDARAGRHQHQPARHGHALLGHRPRLGPGRDPSRGLATKVLAVSRGFITDDSPEPRRSTRAVPAPADAGPTDQLVAFLGRQP